MSIDHISCHTPLYGLRRTAAWLLIAAGLHVSCRVHKSPASPPAAGTYFRIAIIPDIQFYTGRAHGGNIKMFQDQIAWIKQHQADSNIAYVSGMGDTVDDAPADSVKSLDEQWMNASERGYYALETPAPGVPYGVTVGNHDEADMAYPQTDAGNYHNHPGLSPLRNTTENYNKYFGADHFKNKPWYGGHANLPGKNNNDCHYDRFTVSGQQYIVLYIPFDNTGERGEDTAGLMMAWARQVLTAHKNAKAIIVSHSMLKAPSDGNFSAQGLKIFNSVKDMPNVFLMLCGHETGEYMRRDVYEGRTITTCLTDFQGRPFGGNGRMSTLLINTATNTISSHSFSPYSGEGM